MSIGRLISDHKSLAELYSDLLHRQRGIVREQDKGKALCVHCNGPKSGHLPDGRCSCYAMSRNFTNARNDELNRIGEAITLIEKLREL